MTSPIDTAKQQPASTPGSVQTHAEAGDRAAGSGRRRRLWLLVGALALVAVAGAAYWYYWLRQPPLPPGFASGNGRVEATEYDIATKRAGRVVEVRVREGDLVEKGQVLAQIDIEELTAQTHEAEAAARSGLATPKATADAVLVQRKSELKLARIELARAQKLVEGDAARLSSGSTRTGRGARPPRPPFTRRRSSCTRRQSAIAAAEASLQRIQTLLDESTLVSPIRGRVIYRLAEPGEVLDAGGKVVTVLDLADVYMTIFLPTEQAGRVGYGAEARMVLDAFPELVLPASVSFASPEAQFTPKEVETRTEREKLMFRFKVKIDQALLEQHLEQVKTGIPGVSYIRLAGAGEWPEQLAVRLPPE